MGSVAALTLALVVVLVGRSMVSAVRSTEVSAGSPGTNPSSAGAGWPGASRMDQGAPVGYAHTQAGAVQAATNYDALEEGELLTDPTAYRAALMAVVAPSWRSEGADHVERSLAGASSIIASAHDGNSVRLRDVGLSYHVDSFSPVAADVTIWAATTFGVEGKVPATLTSHTARYSLQWLGDWKVSGRTEDLQGPGLRVSLPAPPSSALPPELGSYKGYHDVP